MGGVNCLNGPHIRPDRSFASASEWVPGLCGWGRSVRHRVGVVLIAEHGLVGGAPLVVLPHHLLAPQRSQLLAAGHMAVRFVALLGMQLQQRPEPPAKSCDRLFYLERPFSELQFAACTSGACQNCVTGHHGLNCTGLLSAKSAPKKRCCSAAPEWSSSVSLTISTPKGRA